MSRRNTRVLVHRVTNESTSSTSKSAMKEQQQHQTFPFKLYEMLQYANDSEFSSSLAWAADGSAFIIHDKDVMMDDLTPKFFKQTKFRSFTRQLNIWGFVRTDTLGGERGGWQHENFLRGRPDLLKDIERTEVKSAVSKSSSVTKARASSRSARKAPAKREEKVVVVADESSCSSSRKDSQDSLMDESVPVHDTGISAIASPVLRASQGLVFQYFDHIPVSYVHYVEQRHNQDSVSLSSSSVQQCSDETLAQIASTEQVEAMHRYTVDTTGNVSQPFNAEDLMYLASIFDKDEHSSHDDDLSSILSLNQETSVEDFVSNL